MKIPQRRRAKKIKANFAYFFFFEAEDDNSLTQILFMIIFGKTKIQKKLPKNAHIKYLNPQLYAKKCSH